MDLGQRWREAGEKEGPQGPPNPGTGGRVRKWGLVGRIRLSVKSWALQPEQEKAKMGRCQEWGWKVDLQLKRNPDPLTKSQNPHKSHL